MVSDIMIVVFTICMIVGFGIALGTLYSLRNVVLDFFGIIAIGVGAVTITFALFAIMFGASKLMGL